MINNDIYPVSILSNNDAMSTVRINLDYIFTDSYSMHEIETTFQQERSNEMYVIPTLPENYQEL